MSRFPFSRRSLLGLGLSLGLLAALPAQAEGKGHRRAAYEHIVGFGAQHMWRPAGADRRPVCPVPCR